MTSMNMVTPLLMVAVGVVGVMGVAPRGSPSPFPGVAGRAPGMQKCE